MSEIRNSHLLGKITVVVVICWLVMGSLFANTAIALDGSGTQEDPWRIKSLEDFNDFAADANYWAGFTRLETDANLAGIVYDRAVIAPDVNDEPGWQETGIAFTGLFDGNSHKIMGLVINDAGVDKQFLGLFGYIDDGEVRNLGLEGGSIRGDSIVGGLIGLNLGIISNCYSTGDVNGRGIVGGLCGGNHGPVTSCYATGVVTGQFDVGGLCGVNSHPITSCYATGAVTGEFDVGGMVGYNAGHILNCYSTGDVNGVSYVGCLLGKNYVNVSNCFWNTDTQTHGITNSIGLNQGIATNVSGLPTSQMQTRIMFTEVGWDFINVWDIGENQTYPYLRTYLPSDINKDGIVNFLDLSITANQWMQGVE